MVYKSDQEEGRYRVLLLGVGENSENEIDSFCANLSKNYRIPLPLLKKIVDRCPIILKKNLSLKKAQLLGKTLKSFGATVSIEERRNDPPIVLEFQELVPHQLILESSYLRKTSGATWSVIGRIKNISDEMLRDTWALIQLFDALGEFIAFEEAPLPINPLPPEEGSPFKVVFEGNINIKKISIAFKNALGQPIPVVDKRKKRKWVEVEMMEEDEHFFSFPERPPVTEQQSEMVELTEGSMTATSESSETFLGEEITEDEGGVGEEMSQETLTLTLDEDFSERVLEFPEKDFKNPQEPSEENQYPEGGEAKSPLGPETLQALPFTGGEEEIKNEFPLSTTIFEETTHLLETISEIAVGKEEQEERDKNIKEENIESVKEEVKEEVLPLFPWIEDFRKSVETFYQMRRDIFSVWFEECLKEGGFLNSFHALLTILAYSRFNQKNQPIQALENTQRVFKIIPLTSLPLDEIPLLIGTPFVSGEVWKDLFQRALPKLHQIGNAILEKNRWNASDLERIIQVIPQMGYPNSRLAIRLIHELIPEILEVDFLNIPVFIEEDLYRVASRLGILDPHFDFFQGSHSTGDDKIQSFASMVFPQNPLKIEEPMAWMGMEEEQGGHCFPTQPRCEGCLFESFCPRLYLHFDPSEKGMRK